MKRNTRFTLTILALFTLLTLSAFAKTYTKDIYPGETVTQTLGEDDVCRYNYETDESGFLTVKIISVSSEEASNPTVNVKILKGGSEVSEFDTDRYFEVDKYAAVEGIQSGLISIKVTNTTRFSEISYTLCFEFREYDYVEDEPNNTFEKATPIELTKSYTGGVLHEDNYDWYSFETQSDGYIILSMCVDEPKYFSIYTSDMKCLGDITFVLEDMTKAYEQRVGLPKGKYYVRVSNVEEMTKPKYTFRVSAYMSDGLESEQNDLRDTANAIAIGKEYRGNLTTFEDEDYYSFSLSQKDEVTLKFTDSYLTKSGHFSIYLEDEKGNIVAEKLQCSSAEMTQSLEEGKYFIHLLCPAEKYFSGMSYRFTLTSKLSHNISAPDDNTTPETPDIPEIPETPETPEIPDVPECTVPSFTDVTPDDWYYDDVESAKYYGLIIGVDENTFNPKGNVTLAEAITIAARLHKDRNNSDFDFDGEKYSEWYTGYVEYAVANGIIKSDDFDNYDASATRAEIAYIFSSVLEDSFEVKNDVSKIPDVDEGSRYFDSILKLYKAGILEGNDENGTFFPDSLVSRAECAAVAVRLYSLQSK